MNPIGANYYLKSVDQLRPDAQIGKDVAEATWKLCAETGQNITYIFEFWNLEKVNKVPVDATAFQRTPRLSSLVTIEYKGDTPEQLAVARKSAGILAKIVTAAEGDGNVNNGYANYSGFTLLVCDRSSRFAHDAPDSDAPALIDPHTDEGVLSETKTQALFGSHHAKLAALKQKYDPNLVFNKWYVIKPAGAEFA